MHPIQAPNTNTQTRTVYNKLLTYVNIYLSEFRLSVRFSTFISVTFSYLKISVYGTDHQHLF